MEPHESVASAREHFASRGIVFPYRGISRAEADRCVARLRDLEGGVGRPLTEVLPFHQHLAVTWLFQLAHHPSILDAVEGLLGPNLLLFGSQLWGKGARDPRVVGWHQDSTYIGMEPNELVTVWLALTDSTRENGCMRVLPGTHHAGQQSHEETRDPNNRLSRGQNIPGVAAESALDVELTAGEFSIHHEMLVHGSGANQTDAPRIGMTFLYFPTHVRSRIGRRSARLVRGTDNHGNWDAPPPPPRFDLDPELVEAVAQFSQDYRSRQGRTST